MALYRSAQELLHARLNRRSLLASAGAAAALTIPGIRVSAQDDTVNAEGFKVAFIYIGPVGDLGWTYAQDQGRIALEENLPGITTSYLESVPEVQADAERALRGFAEDGNNLIVATSFGFGPAVLAVAPQYPDIQFVHISGYQTAENVSTAFGKIEEPRYVSGYLAGKMSASGKLGYVAAFPIPEVIRGINAFTLGVRSANPDATVNVVWTNTWYDPTAESSAAQALLDGGADVIAQHQDTPGPQQAAEAAGKYGVGYNVDMSELVPNTILTTPIWHWGTYYTWAATEILSGNWSTNQYWGSWADGLVDLAPIADFVPEDLRTETEALADKFRSGEMGITNIFTGPIMNQNGEIGEVDGVNAGVEDGVSMTDEEILNMMWFVQGVEGSAKG